MLTEVSSTVHWYLFLLYFSYALIVYVMLIDRFIDISAHQPSNLANAQPTYLTYLPTCLPTYLPTYQPINLPTYPNLPAFLPTYLPT
jgi:hypothetical protein